MTNPYSPSNAPLNERRSEDRANSAFKAVLVSCRNGLLWSLAVMVPISFLVVPAIPRRLVRDENGDAVSYIESVGHLGMMQEMLGLVAPIAMIWTLSAGAVGLKRYIRRIDKGKGAIVSGTKLAIVCSRILLAFSAKNS